MSQKADLLIPIGGYVFGVKGRSHSVLGNLSRFACVQPWEPHSKDCGIVCTPSCSITLPVRLVILPFGPTQQKARLRHAKTMPPHQNAHYKGAAAFGGGPFVVWVKLWWHGVGVPQPGLLLGRPKAKDY